MLFLLSMVVWVLHYPIVVLTSLSTWTINWVERLTIILIRHWCTPAPLRLQLGIRTSWMPGRRRIQVQIFRDCSLQKSIHRIRVQTVSLLTQAIWISRILIWDIHCLPVWHRSTMFRIYVFISREKTCSTSLHARDSILAIHWKDTVIRNFILRYVLSQVVFHWHSKH